MSKNKTRSYSSDSDEMMRMLKMLGIVVLILGVFYLWFAIISGEISFGSKKKEVNIQNVEILAGSTFNRGDAESTYYVLMYDFNDKDNANKYNNIYSIYYANGGTEKIYVVDLSKKFNSGYLTDNNSKVNVTSIENLKVVNGTLIKVEKGKGTSKAIGEEQIKKVLLTQ